MSAQPERITLDEATIKMAYDDYMARRKTIPALVRELGVGPKVLRRRWRQRGYPLLLDHRPRSFFANNKASGKYHQQRNMNEDSAAIRNYNPFHPFVPLDGVCVVCDKGEHS